MSTVQHHEFKFCTVRESRKYNVIFQELSRWATYWSMKLFRQLPSLLSVLWSPCMSARAAIDQDSEGLWAGVRISSPALDPLWMFTGPDTSLQWQTPSAVDLALSKKTADMAVCCWQCSWLARCRLTFCFQRSLYSVLNFLSIFRYFDVTG